MYKEQIMRWFSYNHLPAKLQANSKLFADAASEMLVMCATPSDERTAALQKLLEAKDAFVRACIVDAEAGAK
jgi:hypothetical protein